MRKTVTALILGPLAILIIMFAMANREIVTVSFDPFDSMQPAFSLRLPLFILIFILVGAGVVIGGVAAWLKQHKWRSRARRAETDARDLRQQLDAQRSHASLPAPIDSPPLVVPPPV
jgi:uncharacterized integral membrane protein